MGNAIKRHLLDLTRAPALFAPTPARAQKHDATTARQLADVSRNERGSARIAATTATENTGKCQMVQRVAADGPTTNTTETSRVKTGKPITGKT
ncbi:MAG: hypothetical protein RR365_14300, partial [Bacteroides sp.]